jgi:hypothetical protein
MRCTGRNLTANSKMFYLYELSSEADERNFTEGAPNVDLRELRTLRRTERAGSETVCLLVHAPEVEGLRVAEQGIVILKFRRKRRAICKNK